MLFERTSVLEDRGIDLVIGELLHSFWYRRRKCGLDLWGTFVRRWNWVQILQTLQSRLGLTFPIPVLVYVGAVGLVPAMEEAQPLAAIETTGVHTSRIV